MGISNPPGGGRMQRRPPLMAALALCLLAVALIGTPLLVVLLPRWGDIVIVCGGLALWLALTAGTASLSRLGRLAALGCIVAFAVCGTFAAMAREDLKRWLDQVKEERTKVEQERDKAATQTSVADTMRWYVFGPEITRFVDTGKSGGFNLETGMFIPYTPLSPFDSAINDTQWQERYGVDLIADVPANRAPSQSVPRPAQAAYIAGSGLHARTPLPQAAIMVPDFNPSWKTPPAYSPFPDVFQDVIGLKVNSLPQGPAIEISPYLLLTPHPSFDTHVPALRSQTESRLDVGETVSREPPSFVFAGGSALDLPDYNPYANPAQLILSFLSRQTPGARVPPGSSLEEILDMSNLSTPVKGRIIMLPCDGPYKRPGLSRIIFGSSATMNSNFRPGWKSYWLVRTLGGREAVLETSFDLPGDKQPLKISWRFLEKIPPQQTPESIESVLQHDSSNPASHP